jgi:ATP-dependent helicase Lhr and Lhr-like helicase
VQRKLLTQYRDWFAAKRWKPFPFQEETLRAYLEGYSGMLNAPTGSGKTYALWLPILLEWLEANPSRKLPRNAGLQAIWITPVKALAKDIESAMTEACAEMGVPWTVAFRTGDTSLKDRKKQREQVPNCLVTTPESMHVLLAGKGYEDLFKNLKVVVVDEWHELLGTKRGVQVELALSRIRGFNPSLKIWGISATIGNMDEALHVLLGEDIHEAKFRMVRSGADKKIVVESVLPDEIEKFPWAGHLGIKLLPKIVPIIMQGRTTLLFTNTRSQAEIWYQRLLEFAPELAGAIGLHHGSLGHEIRSWIEQALHDEVLKVVVCTSSLDLGVDFRPVETVIQIGSPKGIARFMQRAGRSGHQPGAESRIYFVPTHSLELIEAAALRTAVKEMRVEKRVPLVRTFDVLIQYLVTLAVSDGFRPAELYEEVIKTHAFSGISEEEWAQVLQFITSGGPSLKNYSEYSKVVDEGGVYRVTDKRTAMRHRLSIGTIVSESTLSVKFMKGGHIGTIEEYFISRLKRGDVFSFAGRTLEFVMLKDNTALVRASSSKKAIVPQWMGGRMNLSSQLSQLIREKLTEVIEKSSADEEVEKLTPLFAQQEEDSLIPGDKEFLIETFESREGFHLFFYTFEGRYMNEGLASLLAYRSSQAGGPGSFSIAMNDYGFELLSDQEVQIEELVAKGLFSTDNLVKDIYGGLNTTEMARRKFRSIAHIAGLIFQGFPGKKVRDRHLQASSRLFFEVFRDFEPGNLLLRQAYEEVLYDQLDEIRLRRVLDRISHQEIKIVRLSRPSPFSFPIMVEMFREKLNNEKLEEKVMKMLRKLEK